MKKTIEEVAKERWGNVHRTGVLGFIDGAKHQSEQMYSEEEVELIAKNTAIEYVRQEFKFVNEDRLEDRYNHFRINNNIIKS